MQRQLVWLLLLGSAIGGWPGGNANSSVLAAAPLEKDLNTLQLWANQEKKLLESLLKVKLATPMVVGREAFPPKDDPHPDDPAHSSRWTGSGQAWAEGCRVTVFNVGALLDESELRSVLAHEIYHCFQDEWIGSYSTWKTMPGWVMEGSARWVGEYLHPTTLQGTDGDWQEYFRKPDKSLFERRYDAVGFFGHMQDVAGAGAVWGRLRPMVVAAAKGGSPAAYLTFLDTLHDPFVRSWASSYFRQPAYGNDWTASGPGKMPDPAPIIQSPTLANGSWADFKALAYSVADGQIASKADVLQITPTNSVRVAGPGFDQTLTETLAICTTTKGCSCPADTPGEAPSLTVITSDPGRLIRLAVTGDRAGSNAHAEGLSVEDYCKQAPKPRLGCALLTPADFAAVGLTGAHEPTDFDKPAGSHYCTYRGRSGATGGIELDVFVDQTGLDAHRTYTLALAEGLPATAQPVDLPGLSEGLMWPAATDHAWLVARRRNLTIAISFGATPRAREQLLALAALVLKRAPQ